MLLTSKFSENNIIKIKIKPNQKKTRRASRWVPALLFRWFNVLGVVVLPGVPLVPQKLGIHLNPKIQELKTLKEKNYKIRTKLKNQEEKTKLTPLVEVWRCLWGFLMPFLWALRDWLWAVWFLDLAMSAIQKSNSKTSN